MMRIDMITKLILTTFTAVFFMLLTTPSTMAITRVRGYYKHTTYSYVQPHYRTTRNNSKYDNWSTKGNTNPYTGKRGYKSL